MKSLTLTKEEQKAIASLQRLAKRWPKTLWLFSANGSLEVYKFKSDGTPSIDGEESVDHKYNVATIQGIFNDGGDY